MHVWCNQVSSKAPMNTMFFLNFILLYYFWPAQLPKQMVCSFLNIEMCFIFAYPPNLKFNNNKKNNKSAFSFIATGEEQ